MPNHGTSIVFRVCALILLGQILPGCARAQNPPSITSVNLVPTNSLPSTDASTTHFKETERPKQQMNRKAFVAMSAAVYGFAFLDMHETKSFGLSLIEHDPLARPFTRLPTPAYYVTGAAMTTGVNFVAWRLGHSRRWHKLWWIPQAACAYGNIYGYGTTKARE